MNFAHLHLMLNELPIWGAAFAATLFLVAAITLEREGWVYAGLVLLGISVAGSLGAFLTGIPAVDVITGAPRTSGKALSEHHVRGIIAAGCTLVSGVVGTAVVVRRRKRHVPPDRLSIAMLLGVSALQAAALGWTAQAGGRINHPELQEAGDLEHGPAGPH
jgi:hypothetical protein